MRFQTPLLPATLLRRYKRFLADVRLEDGREVTAHCANPGRMTGLADPGTRIWVEPNEDPKRKLRYAWKLAELPGGHLACVDTGAANRIIQGALEAGTLPALRGYDSVLPERTYGQGSRVDFLLEGGALPPIHVEVKSVTLSRISGLAEFPDTVTARGARHLRDLADVAMGGGRAALVYLVQRGDCTRVAVAADIDPAYAAAMDAARAAGVTVLAHAADIGREQITIGAQLPVE